MNTSRARIAAGLLSLLVSTAVCCSKPETRSVAPLYSEDSNATPKFTRELATGLFVGVREFPGDKSLDVPYACDDAVDLAYRFALDQRVGLIPPKRVVIALSGVPQKLESKQRLRKLKEAGASVVRNVTSADILALLQQQAAAADKDGLLVLSIASHGFQQHGDAYILGSTSTFNAPETSVRAVTLYDIAAEARRSLIFIDACRDRIQPGTRSGASDPAAAAPHIRRMNRVQGQVIFYAAAPGEYAFDDYVNRNGVFTKAVLDGLDCEASAPRGTVLVETLHSYVDHAVRRWIHDNKQRDVNPATQISMEGETRNMPLCDCWRPEGPKIRVATDGSILTAYGENTRPLWRKDFHEPIVHAEAADLDADAWYEVVVGLRDRIEVLDRDGKPRWTLRDDTRTLRHFAVDDLFRKHTKQIVALWYDARRSRMTVLDANRKELSSFVSDEPLLRVAIGRPTNMHAPKIVIATKNSLMLFHAKKHERGVPLWRQMLRSAASDAIENVQIGDGNADSRSDIGVSTALGTTWFAFDGKILRQNAKETWERVRAKRKRK
ncbi:MAG TPA: caspase family protein [Thermoanaerobaculia bacterium]|nr:caspase family protein [Thermoanaerobaculia bacterium]